MTSVVQHEQVVDMSFRVEVRHVLIEAASLPMVCLGILESWTDEDLEMHRGALGDATDVACFIANVSVNQMALDEAVKVLKVVSPKVRDHAESCDCGQCKLHRDAVDVVYADVADEG